MVRFFTQYLPIAFTLKTMLAQTCSRLGKFLQTLKRLSGHVECSFDNHAEKFLPKGQKFFAESPENDKLNIFFFKKI